MPRLAHAPRLAIALGTGVLAAPGTARADEPPMLAWDAPAACPDESRVRAAIERWLDLPDGRSALQPSVRVRAAVHPAEAGWTLELTVSSPGGSEQQTLTAESCEALVEVVALKAALAAAPVAMTTSLANAESRGPDSSTRPVFALRAEAGTGVGVVPAPSAFAGVTGSIDSSSWRAEMGAVAWPPTAARYPALPAIGADISLWAGTARGCLVPSRGAIDVPICAGAAIGAMRGRGFGVAMTETSTQLWAAALVGPALRIRVGPSLAVWFAVDAALALERPEFHMRNLDLLYRPDLVSAEASIGLEFRL